MDENILNSYTILTVLSFLVVFILIGFFIRQKSSSLKKIINNKKINVLEFETIRGGYSAIIFSVEKEKFFFVSHKSGNSNLVQIFQSNNQTQRDFLETPEKSQETKQEANNSHQFNNEEKSSSTGEKKPLQQVKISDLLALHKKS